MRIHGVIIGLFLSFLWVSVPAAQAYCGDGIVEADNGEVCDDGNFDNRDGCSSYCETEDLVLPTVTAVSIPEGAENIPTNTTTIVVSFSEPVHPDSVIQNNISVSHNALPLGIEFTVSGDGYEVMIELQEELVSEASHALRIKNVRDVAGNALKEEFIRVFSTATHVDRTPPFVVADPPAGEYHYTQDVSLIPYLSEKEFGPGFRDDSTRIYYTVDDSYPTTNSILFSHSFAIDEHTTLKFFGIDGSGNRSQVFTQIYRFGCQDRLHAKRISPYPLCRVLECERNFILRSNTCITQLGEVSETNASIENAFTAPMFSSDTPLTVSSKPAIQITYQHKGIIKRPIIFRNIKGESEVRFNRDTTITDEEGKAFAGYLTPPISRFSKDFPPNFGYSFKSILEFTPLDGRRLHFDKPYRIVVPFSNRFNNGEEVTVFTHDSSTEEYAKIASDKVVTDLTAKSVTLSANETGIFFFAQSGEKFSKAEFTDMDSHWARNYAEALYRRGIVKGRSKGVYDPDAELNRAEFTKIAIEAIGAEVESSDDIENTYFPDVNLYAWYTPYVNKAKELGLIEGYTDGTFRPEKSINRAEAIKILMRAFDFDLSGADGFLSEKEFKDVDKTSWYYSTMNFAIKHGLLSGIRTKNGTILSDFGPGRNMTRGEMAQLALKAIELHEAK